MWKPNSIIVLLQVFQQFTTTFSSAGVKLRQNIGQSGFMLWFLQVLLRQIIIQFLYACFCCSLGVFRIFIFDQNFQFLFGNGGKSLSHIFKSLAALLGRGAWKLGGLWTRHDNPISDIADIGLSCQVHMLLYIDWMLVTNHMFQSNSNV